MSDPRAIINNRLNAVLKQITGPKTLEEAGRLVIAIIEKRVQDGRDLDGNPFAEYSAKYLSYKINGLSRRANRAPHNTNTRRRIFTAIGAAYSGQVDLQATGRMMRDIHTNIVEISGLHTIEIGYLRGKSATDNMEKARWHNKDGAGKSKIKRKFVGLMSEEGRQIFEYFRSQA